MSGSDSTITAEQAGSRRAPVRVCPACGHRTPERACPVDGVMTNIDYDAVPASESGDAHDPRAAGPAAPAGAGASPGVADAIGRVLHGRYRLDGLLARGGMGAVYRATQLSLDRQVAVKILEGRRRLDDRARARFELEARTLARLTHPNIVRLLDVGSDPVLGMFVVMELIDGRPLRDLTRRPSKYVSNRRGDGPLAVADKVSNMMGSDPLLYDWGDGDARQKVSNMRGSDPLLYDRKVSNVMGSDPLVYEGDGGGIVRAGRALEIVAALLDGLADAHGQGIVHRDLKPGNILLVAGADGLDRVKILDFGLAKLVAELSESDAGLTRTGAVVGTPAYLAPEVAAGCVAEPASDLYAVGLIGYELLYGRRPYEPSTAAQWYLAHQTATVRLPDVGPDLSARALRALVGQCLQKDPARRPASAVLAAAQLRAQPGIFSDPSAAHVPVAPPASGPLPWIPWVIAVVAVVVAAASWWPSAADLHPVATESGAQRLGLAEASLWPADTTPPRAVDAPVRPVASDVVRPLAVEDGEAPRTAPAEVVPSAPTSAKAAKVRAKRPRPASGSAPAAAALPPESEPTPTPRRVYPVLP